MRKTAFLCFLVLFVICESKNAFGVVRKEIPTPTIQAEASATAVLRPTDVKIKENITEPRSRLGAYKLESVFDKYKGQGWNGLNTIRKVEEMAIERGVAANTVVMLLLLPLVATVVSLLHYLVGLSGYGIFMPTMIAVALLATGIAGGLTLFALILAISLMSNMLLKKFKLHFWPARSINLMFISAGTFGLMVASTYLRVLDISKISIFPILFMIMLAEEFVRTQLAKSKSEAKKLMLGTLVLAMVGAATMSVRSIQETVLLYPEMCLILGLAVNLAVGSYTGIRLLEIKRFKKAIRKKG
jgi:hypothetical protein